MPNLVYTFAYSNAYTPAMPMVELGINAYEEPIVGRNVLNHLVITLNGLAGVTEVWA